MGSRPSRFIHGGHQISSLDSCCLQRSRLGLLSNALYVCQVVRKDLFVAAFLRESLKSLHAFLTTDSKSRSLLSAFLSIRQTPSVILQYQSTDDNQLPHPAAPTPPTRPILLLSNMLRRFRGFLLCLLAIGPAAPECRAQSRIVVRKIKHILRQARGLNDAPHLDGALVLDQSPNCVEQLRRKLAVPPVLPRNEPDRRRHRLASVLVFLEDSQDARECLGAESLGQTRAVCLNRLVGVLQPFRERAQNLPLLRGLLVLHALRPVLCHLCTPDGIYAEVLVEYHKQAIEPPLAQALIIQL